MEFLESLNSSTADLLNNNKRHNFKYCQVLQS